MSDPVPLTNADPTVSRRTAQSLPAAPTQDLHADPGNPRPSVSSSVQVPGYRIEGILGRGGMGVVYKAIQEKANRPVALKMILAGAHADQSDRIRFSAEAEAAARLSHPNIVQLYEVGETREGFPFFSLEYVAGGTLGERLQHGPLPPREAAAMMEALARAMQYAHERGIVHRDLKPANVLLQFADCRLQIEEKDNSTLTAGTTAKPGSQSAICNLQSAIPKISDFGLAKQLDSEDGMTRTGAIMGTPSYMAPEQAFGQSKNVGPAADIYALGAILYECLTGRPPFKGATVADTLEQVRTMEPISLCSFAREIPRDLDTICLHCLHKDPQRRYASAEALADDLRRYQEQRPISVRPVGAPERVWRWCRRNPGWAAMIGLVVFSACAVMGILVDSNIKISKVNEDLKSQTKIAQDNEKEAKKQTKLAVEKSELAQSRLTQSLEAVGLFTTDARIFCEDALVPGPSKAKLNEVLLKQLEKQVEFDAGEASVDSLRNKAFMYQSIAQVQGESVNGYTARQSCEKGLATVDQWLKLHPGDPVALSRRASLWHWIGVTLQSESVAKEAERYFLMALEIRQKLAGNEKVDELSPGKSLTELADSLQALGRFDEALELRSKVCGRDRRFTHLGAWCETCFRAGEKSIDYKAKQAYLVKADELSLDLEVKNPTSRPVLMRHAKILRQLNDLYLNHKEPIKALDASTKLAAVTQKLATSGDLVEPLRQYAQSFYALAVLQRKQDQIERSRDNFKRSLDIREQILRDYPYHVFAENSKVDRLFSLAAVGKHAQATKLADAMFDRARFNPKGEKSLLYRLACIYSLSIPAVEEGRRPNLLSDADKKTQADYRDKALECLDLSHKGGNNDFYNTRVDTDLESIRNDPRFQEILAKYQKK